MKLDIKQKLLKFWDKFKQSKKLQVLTAIIFAVLILTVYFCFSYGKNNKKVEDKDQTATTNSYVENLENKLQNVLSNIDGAGTIKVVITLESGFEYVYATEETVKTTSSGTLTSQSVVLVSGQPIIVKEIYPTIKGVVVVSSGAKDIGVKMRLFEAVHTVMEISNEKITILN